MKKIGEREGNNTDFSEIGDLDKEEWRTLGEEVRKVHESRPGLIGLLKNIADNLQEEANSRPADLTPSQETGPTLK